MHAMRLQNTTEKEIKMKKNNGKTAQMKKLSTVGWVKSIDLSAKTFTIEPVSLYQFQIDEKDDKSRKIIFRDESKGNAVKSLYLCGVEQCFEIEDNLISALIILKQNKSKIKVSVSGTTGGSIPCEINII